MMILKKQAWFNANYSFMIKPWIYHKACVCPAISRWGPFSKYLNSFSFLLLLSFYIICPENCFHTSPVFPQELFVTAMGKVWNYTNPGSRYFTSHWLTSACMCADEWFFLLSSLPTRPLFHFYSWTVIIICRSFLLDLSPWGQHFFF